MTTTTEEFRITVAAEIVERTVAAHPAAIADEIEWLYNHYLAEQMPIAELSLGIKLDRSNIPRVWSGTYNGNYANVALRIKTYRENWMKEHGAGQPDFLRTSLAVEVFDVCDSVRATREIGVIRGPWGCGKTVALQEYAANQGQVVRYFECSESPAYGVFLADLARSLGITSKSSYAQRESIAKRLRRNRVELLIIDEAHAPFETIRFHKGNPGPTRMVNYLRREIYDKLGIPILLCGTNTLTEHLSQGIWKRTIAQLLDRGDTELDLTDYMPTRQDLAAFYKFYHLAADPPKEALQRVRDILTAHSLRKLIFRLRKSARAAHRMGQPHTWDHFLDACDLKAAESSPTSDIINRK